MDPKSHSLHLWWNQHVESTLQGMDSTYRLLPLRACVYMLYYVHNHIILLYIHLLHNVCLLLLCYMYM